MASVDDLWLTDFGDPSPGEPAHHRPALIVGPDATFGPDLPFVIVCPLTTHPRGLSLHVEVEPDPDNGLDEPSHVQCELIRSIGRRRLVHRLGHVDGGTSCAVAAVIRALLGS